MYLLACLLSGGVSWIGAFEVRLHFAEIYSGVFSANARVFDVVIEGVEAFPSLDIYSEAGPYTALTKVRHFKPCLVRDADM